MHPDHLPELREILDLSTSLERRIYFFLEVLPLKGLSEAASISHTLYLYLQEVLKDHDSNP